MKTSSVGILALAIVAFVCLSSRANAEVSARNRLKGAGRPKSGSNWAPGTRGGHALSLRTLSPRLSGCPARRFWGGAGRGITIGSSSWVPVCGRLHLTVDPIPIRTNPKQNTEATAKLFKVSQHMSACICLGQVVAGHWAWAGISQGQTPATPKEI